MINELPEEHTMLSFGKYIGRYIIEVIVSDPMYITWLVDNGMLDKELVERLKERLEQC